MSTDSAVSPGSLPAEPNSFIGRERDLAELESLIGQVRALTLCGPGGIGKTRLALRLAAGLAPSFPHGAWLADLADTTRPELLVPRIAAALGVRQEPDRPLADTLADALRSRSLLLVLDTCERLVAPVAELVQRLLGGCPGLRVIATSREPLRLRGETTWRVPPLGVPAEHGGNGAGPPIPGGNEAMRLFADRAAAARPGFRLTPDNAGAVARVCRTLDGMPLAIELAAARVRALSVGQIADRLVDRFRLLDSGERTAPRRQQTLRAAVDWSYELLTEPEQALLRRLSVFSGWSLEAAEQVCSDDLIPSAAVLDLVTALIDKSLVTIDGELNGRARYRLLDTIREYAGGRAAEAGEAGPLRRRHRDYVLALFESMVAAAFVRGDPPWPDRVAMYWLAAAMRPNCIAALAYCHEHGDAEQGLRLCFSMRSTWLADGDASEGAAWLDRFLALEQVVAPGVRGRALSVRAELAFEQQDYAAAARAASECLRVSRAEQAGNEAGASRMLGLIALRAGRTDDALANVDAAIAAARTAGDDWEEGVALTARATVIARTGRLDAAQAAFDAAIEVLRDNNGWGVAQARYGSGRLALARGDAQAAARHFGAALALYRQIDVRPEMARCLAGIGAVALAQHDLLLARSSLRESLQLSLVTGQRLAVARGLEATAALAAVAGDLVRAVRLAGAALALREVIGDRPSAAAAGQLDLLLAAAGAALGAAATDVLLAEGRAMSPDAAVQFAAAGPDGDRAGEAAARAGSLGPLAAASVVPTPPPGAVPDDLAAHPTAVSLLTVRELQIADLVTSGMSNRAIAAALVISPATVARHVANIFGKLGFSSRSQVAAWISSHADRDSRDGGGTGSGGPGGGSRSLPPAPGPRDGDRRALRASGGADTYPDTYS